MTTTYLIVPVPENISTAFIAMVHLHSPLSDTEIATDESTSVCREQTISAEWTVDLLGEKYLAASRRDALLWVLRRLQDLDDSFLEALSQSFVRTKRIVGRSPEHLYPLRPDLRRETREVCPGWWADCLLSEKAILKRLQIACELTGLEFGTDLKVDFDILGIQPLSDDEY